MLKKFLNNIIKNKIFNTENKILLTVSGGIDSVVMFHLFLKTKLNFAVCHCNFKLREESDEDAIFVKKLSEENNIKYFETSFDTLKFAKENKFSIQMAARSLRYEWFEKIRNENNFNFIATAHNKNDITETFLINLTRGTGIRGLTGIKIKKNKIIRPMINFSRKEIFDFKEKNKIIYTEDASNFSTKYIRNKIRHKIIPILEEINPYFIETMEENIGRLKENFKIYENAILEKKEKVFFYEKDLIFLKKLEIENLENKEIFFYEFLKDFGFNRIQSDKILKSFNAVGKQFFSKEFRILIDRENIIIKKNVKNEKKIFFIKKNSKEINYPISLNFEIINNKKDFIFQKENCFANLDFEKLKFPLLLRNWKKGDYFYPFGMYGKKKLSDFFTDKKFSIFEKEKIMLLISDEKIVWIIGQRIDRRFKIDKKTKKIFRIEKLKNKF